MYQIWRGLVDFQKFFTIRELSLMEEGIGEKMKKIVLLVSNSESVQKFTLEITLSCPRTKSCRCLRIHYKLVLEPSVLPHIK